MCWRARVCVYALVQLTHIPAAHVHHRRLIGVLQPVEKSVEVVICGDIIMKLDAAELNCERERARLCLLVIVLLPMPRLVMVARARSNWFVSSVRLRKNRQDKKDEICLKNDLRLLDKCNSVISSVFSGAFPVLNWS